MSGHYNADKSPSHHVSIKPPKPFSQMTDAEYENWYYAAEEAGRNRREERNRALLAIEQRAEGVRRPHVRERISQAQRRNWDNPSYRAHQTEMRRKIGKARKEAREAANK